MIDGVAILLAALTEYVHRYRTEPIAPTQTDIESLLSGQKPFILLFEEKFGFSSSKPKLNVILAEIALQTGTIWDAVGSAHTKLKAEFVDRDLIGSGDREPVPPKISDEVAFLTPGFSGWQQERWFTHCGDAAEFLGPMGKEQTSAIGVRSCRSHKNRGRPCCNRVERILRIAE